MDIKTLGSQTLPFLCKSTERRDIITNNIHLTTFCFLDETRFEPFPRGPQVRVFRIFPQHLSVIQFSFHSNERKGRRDCSPVILRSLVRGARARTHTHTVCLVNETRPKGNKVKITAAAVAAAVLAVWIYLSLGEQFNKLSN